MIDPMLRYQPEGGRERCHEYVSHPDHQPGTELRTGALVEAVLQATVPWAAA